MSALKALVAMAELPNILSAAQVLERSGMLLNGERAADVVKRYVAKHPEINEALGRTDSLINRASA